MFVNVAKLALDQNQEVRNKNCQECNHEKVELKPDLQYITPYLY